MEIVSLIVAVYNLIVRAIALALSDPEFAKDWRDIENALEAMGVDVPGFVPDGAGSGAGQAAGQGEPGVTNNPDGSVSLKGD